ncbi:hypothetical protein SS50377_23856 [Spironucleus salmonicida]|uniref:Uncharacterized protein n=1 Tax=Spironucleus salmonicida TaxID=348837 RepID=V6LK99_9EUKA|nr:hypothetical protein SS50377_23856 [Spironucleus salmonicida]|eukprot:EST44156.1 hypothetical protein SS50377_16060 [Spironucleus salmonicida]
MLFAIQLTCFNQYAELEGINQQLQFNVYFQPAYSIDSKCVAFNNSKAVVYLQYLDAGAVKEITSEFQYYSDRNLTVEVKSVANATFQAMALLSRLAYKVNISGQLEFPGSFYRIQNTQANISNCWSDLQLKYLRVGPGAYLSLEAQPNFCAIRDPVLEFQYLVSGEWHSIEIKANTSTGPGGFKFPYVHLDTKFYQVFKDQLNESQQNEFNMFFEQFTIDRSLQLRMQMHYTTAGSTLIKQIVSQVLVTQSDNNQYLENIKVRSIVSSLGFDVIGEFSQLADIDQKYKVQLQVLFQQMQLELYNDLYNLAQMLSITFYFREENISVLQLPDNLQMQFFFVIYDDETIIHEESVFVDVIISCFTAMNIIVSRSETSVVVFPTNTERCAKLYSNGLPIYVEQVLQLDKTTVSRTTFQAMLKELKFEPRQFYKLELGRANALTTSNFTLAEGDFYQRQKAYISKAKSSTMTLTYVTNNFEFFNNLDIAFEDTATLLYPTIGIFGGILIGIIIYISIVTPNLQ